MFGGDVLLQRDIAAKRRRERSRSRSRSRSLSETIEEEEDDDFDLCDTTPTIDAQGELAGRLRLYVCDISCFLNEMYRIGLHLYSISQPFVLLPKSTFGLPFINATIQITKYVGLTLPFTSHTQIRKLQRKYRIESIDKFLPTGSLTIREQGHLVGVTTLPDMAVGDKHTLSAGQDPDVRSFSFSLFVYVHVCYRLGFIKSTSKINLERKTFRCVCCSPNFQKCQVNTGEI